MSLSKREATLTDKFPKQLRKGERFQQWISNTSTEPCPVSRTELTLNGLDVSDWISAQSVRDLSHEHCPEEFRFLDLPNGQYHYMNHACPFIESIWWEGYVAPGIIFIDVINRNKNANGPYISELSIACYREFYEMSSLRHIFVSHIVNAETRLLIDHLYPSPQSGILEHGTPGYMSMLGTPIGRVVASIILGGANQGSMKIARVTIWWTGGFCQAQARFDIEPVEA